jgi:hypothetical protein
MLGGPFGERVCPTQSVGPSMAVILSVYVLAG